MIDILVFVEDDGAANMMRGMRSYFTERQLDLVVVAVGAAKTKLQLIGEEHVTIEVKVTAEALLDTWQPRIVVVGTAQNSETIGFSLVHAARGRGLTTVGLVDAYVNSRWRWRGETEQPLAYAPDWLVVPDEYTRQEYMALGAVAERIIVVGYVQVGYVYDRAKQLRRQGRQAIRDAIFSAAQARQIVVFVAENFGGLDARQHCRTAEYTLEGWGNSDERVCIVFEEILEAFGRLKLDPFLVLRMHPKNEADDFVTYRDQIQYVSRIEAPMEVVYGADIIIGMTSTLLLEAALLGLPTLSVLPREQEKQWLPSIGAGVTPAAITRAQIDYWLPIIMTDKYQPPPWPPAWQPGPRPRLCDFLKNLVVYESAIAATS